MEAIFPKRIAISFSGDRSTTLRTGSDAVDLDALVLYNEQIWELIFQRPSPGSSGATTHLLSLYSSQVMPNHAYRLDMALKSKSVARHWA